LLMLWINQVKDRALPFLICSIFFFSYNFSKSPNLANHANYYMVICLCMALWAGYSWYRNKDLTEAFLIKDFESVRPIICLSLFVVYFMAGWHKLNADFFNPEVSCASDFFLRYAREYNFDASYIPQFFLDWSPHLVVFVELGGAMLLLIPRTQLLGVLSFVGLHSYLVPLSFYDFASICYSILLCFLPSEIYQGEENRARAQKGMNFLVASAVAGSVVARLMIDYEWDHIIYSDVAQGWFYLAGSFYFIFQLYKNMKACGLSPFTVRGPNLFEFSKMSPRWMVVMPALLLLYTNTSYMGLRTAGNTSMFSNLRTEGGATNHFVMPSWQPFGYQRDLIFVEEIEPEYARWMRGQPDIGMMMSTFELRRIVEMWKDAGKSNIRMVFKHKGEVKYYEDITKSKRWADNPLPWLAKKLMLFREIQPSGPNRCRW
jgi:hypothetical protein